MKNTYKIKPLKNRIEALRIINFFLKKGVFEQTWAPGEKALLKSSVINSLKIRKHQYYYIISENEIIGAIGIRENLYKTVAMKLVKIILLLIMITGDLG